MEPANTALHPTAAGTGAERPRVSAIVRRTNLGGRGCDPKEGTVMNTITPAIRDFFDRYAGSRTAQDINAIASQYPDAFMTAGPNGARVAQKSAVIAGFPKGQEFLKSLGHESTEVVSLHESRMAEHYVLIRASFVWRFRRPSMPPTEAKVDSTFILYVDKDAPKIVFQHEQEEFQQALRAGGVLPAQT
jgi:hypothetical protein